MGIYNYKYYCDLRRKEKLTQLSFSRLLGVSKGYISAIENGKKEPSQTLILAIESILGSKPNKEHSNIKKKENYGSGKDLEMLIKKVMEIYNWQGNDSVLNRKTLINSVSLVYKKMLRNQ